MLWRSVLVSVGCAVVSLSVIVATASAEIVIPRPQAAPVRVQIEPVEPTPVLVPHTVGEADQVLPEQQSRLNEATRNTAHEEELDLAALGTAVGETLEALARSCLAGAFQVAKNDLGAALGLGDTIDLDSELRNAFAACFEKQLASQGVPGPAAHAAAASLGGALADTATTVAATAADAQGNGTVYARWLGDTGSAIANPAAQPTAIDTATAAPIQPNPVSAATTPNSSTPSSGLIIAAIFLFGGAALVLIVRRWRSRPGR